MWVVGRSYISKGVIPVATLSAVHEQVAYRFSMLFPRHVGCFEFHELLQVQVYYMNVGVGCVYRGVFSPSLPAGLCEAEKHRTPLENTKLSKLIIGEVLQYAFRKVCDRLLFGRIVVNLITDFNILG
jgi:hypothetical protein